jgi:hypothetical protein
VQDDDLEQSPERETVRVSLAEGALPPGLELSGPDYYPEVDANGEAVIRGTIQPHGAAEATQYYLPRFRAWDNAGSNALSPFVALATTDFKVTVVSIRPVGTFRTASDGAILLKEGDTLSFDLWIGGVGGGGSMPGWDGNIRWGVFDDDPGFDDLIKDYSSVTPDLLPTPNPTGAWQVNAGTFTLRASRGEIYGDAGVGLGVGWEGDIEVYVHIWWYCNCPFCWGRHDYRSYIVRVRYEP